MTVTVLMFAQARDLAGARELAVEIGDEATVGELRRALLAECPALQPILGHCSFSVDRRHASDDVRLTPESEVGCIPPVSGG
jgi:molybdopterin synthase catalytic subunit